VQQRQELDSSGAMTMTSNLSVNAFDPDRP
jgi:hypothetical protein